ncbi:RHS repeat-associated core domain-containing protein [Shewanella fidelis]|uniref:NucA/NucB deoxyribonuclease domain-containing protein n=1 Tax=Shewanella fidelis TaxID=173509 RepID=A0ABU4HBL8_9GAMM|nr:RHS repeat-associated core domain-containing protein [Shewanella fidelis]MDW4812180.1 NucA/NucB deoxyribonuclease domain-containing protein [Shewanella fidelis]MDW4816156.1 NucA/NucB deoxyribonuclease domain-containing protein [Shewanella fidelis]MDW4820421.1 NucA/NucB deoxyribonuclease domain-containing protein [Shewanella fidelis]MDW4824643.1 NucA/NucB deoxyribonuclease domain-containing protein [Shewanella fidelis]
MTNSSIAISWSAASTATSYTLQESRNNATWSTIASPKTTSFSRSGRSNGSYKYRVRGCNASGCGSWRNSSSVTVLLPPPAPSAINIPSTTVTNGSIAISWSAASTATSYTLQESRNNATWSTIASPKTTSFSRSGRSNGSYKYRVRGCNASGCGSWRNSSSVTVLLPPPVPSAINIPSSTVTNGSIAISWSAASTATSYTLQESRNNATWSTIASPKTTSFSRSGRSNGSYKYRVRGCNASGCGSWRNSSSVTVLLPPPVPSAINIPSSTVTNGSIAISWSAASTATSYTLQESRNNATWSTIASPKTTSFTRSGRSNGSYKYRVRGCNTSGCSNWRDSITVNVTLPPEWRQTRPTEVNDAGGSSSLPSATVDLSAAFVNGMASVVGGQASYQVPIELPPGRNGIQPKVSLSYNSQSGNGIAGVGWSLNAGSVISRCSATYAQDGFNRSVMFDAYTDRLCLDGQRLINVQGLYGESGTVYRTEMDSFVKVEQNGSLNSSGTSFVAERANGSTVYYGNNINSRLVPEGVSQTFSWKVSQESWGDGKNTIDYEYSTPVSGEHLLSKIYYTGQDGVFGDRIVSFVYETRTDKRSSYINGGKFAKTKRLKQIDTFASDIGKVLSYQFGYINSDSSKQSLVEKIKLCGYTYGIESCAPASQFSWQNAQYIAEPKVLSIGGRKPYVGVTRIHEILPQGDIDGDGSRDFPGLNTDSEQNETGSNNVDVNFSCYLSRYGKYSCLELDVDQDGINDAYHGNNGRLNIAYSSSGGDGNAEYQDTGILYSIPTMHNDSLSHIDNFDRLLSSSDMDGDGYPDLTIYRVERGIASGMQDQRGRVYIDVYRHNQSSIAPFYSKYDFTRIYELEKSSAYGFSTFDFRPTESIIPLGDIDGNGLADFALEKSVLDGKPRPDGKPYKLLLNVSDPNNINFTTQAVQGFSNYTTNALEERYFHQFIDVNGDGLADLIGWNGNALSLKLNLGGYFGDTQVLSDTPLLEERSYTYVVQGGFGVAAVLDFYVPKFLDSLKVADINGDGKNELLFPSERLVSTCADIRGEVLCGDELYGAVTLQVGAPYPANEILINASRKDDSIYRFSALYFDEDIDGSYTVREEETPYVGSASESAFIDAFGDGNIDLLTTYGNRQGIQNHVDFANSDPYWLSVFASEGAYIARNYGSGDGTSYGEYGPIDKLSIANIPSNKEVVWHYKPLSTGTASAGQQTMYSTQHPYVGDGYIHFASSMYVVQSFEQSNGTGSSNTTEYAYKGAMFNLQGRGFTGFREIIEKDVARDKITSSVFKQKFPEVGLLESQTVKVGGTVVATTAQVWADNPQHSITGVHNNINTSTITHNYGLRGSSEQRSSIEQYVDLANVDEYGNIGILTKIVTDYVDGGANSYQTDVSTEFTPDVDNWFLTKYKSRKTTTSVIERNWANDPYANADTVLWRKLSVNTWHPSHHKPLNVTYSASGSGCNRVETSELNDYGLPTLISVMGQSSSCGQLTARTTAFTYTKNGNNEAEDGYLPYTETNAKNHVTTTNYDVGLGVPTKVIAPNNIIIETEYDAIGRPVSISQSGNPTKYLRYLLATSGSHAPNHAKLMTRTTSAGMPSQELYLDGLGRTLRTATQGFDGSSYQYLDKKYDSLGHLTHESLSYYEGHTPEYTIFSGFDAFDRPSTRRLPNGESGGLVSNYTYTGLKTDISVEGRTMSRTYGMQGLLYETVDAAGGSNRFAYDGAGRPLVIQDANGQKIVASYNGFGHKTRVIDPNQGTTTFGYNTLGELDRQTDANGAVQSFVFDTLGRIKTKNVTGSHANGSASFDWDTQKKGMLSSEVQNGITRHYTYTSNLQLATSSVKVADSVGGDNVTRTVSHQYDSFYGRPKGLTYPNGLTLEYRYNDSGYLYQTRNAASGYSYQTVTDMDAAGHVTGSQMANSLLEQTSRYNNEGTMASTQVSSNLGLLHSHYYDRYDSFMNLVDERNGVTGLEKHYEYDNLNRLELYRFSNAGFALYNGGTAFNATINYGYDAVGNLLKKSDYSSNTANAYEYNSSCATGSNAGPNAVCAITKLNGTKVSFSYDRRGNLITGDGLTMTYNALDKPLSINGRGPNNNTSTVFVYGSDNMRALQTRTVSGKTTKTYYVDKLFEADNDGSWRAYIDDIAVLSYTPERNHQLLYTLRDRLGSATTMVDHNGNIITQRYFDPFGRTASSAVAGSLGDLLDTNRNRRGFTDHEHLNEQQLIHMNGRVYDYNLGRFMSVDPFIQAPTSTQSVNPYSYIMNNPLAGTDPTGYLWMYPMPGGGFSTDKLKSTENGLSKGGSVEAIPFSSSGADTSQRSAPADVKTSEIGGQGSIAQQSYGNNADFAEGYSSVEGDMTGVLSWTGAGQAVDSIKSGVDAFEAGYEEYLETGSLTGAAVIAGKAGVEAYVERKLKLGRGPDVAKEIPISRAKYGDAAEHITDAQKAGHPDILTIARDGAGANRKASIGGIPKVQGKQLDEYPPAMFREGGSGASVRPITPRNNMGAGACIGNACRGLSNGDKVRIKVVD